MLEESVRVLDQQKEVLYKVTSTGDEKQYAD
jgi:hypothetical protein